MFDLLFRNAMIVDGTESAARPGHVGVVGDRIAWVGTSPASGGVSAGYPPDPAADRPAKQVVEAEGMVLAPGFIDIHTHSDVTPLVEPWMESALRQGVTTVVVGNCGHSAAPVERAGAARDVLFDDLGEHVPERWATLDEYFEILAGRGPACNVMSLVGHGTVRRAVMGTQWRPPTPEELDRMWALVAEAMAAGAVGLSTGLVYVPGMYADTDEIVALARVVAKHGGIYASHIRGEGEMVFRAVAEAVEVGERAGVPVQVSHLKLESELMWGRAAELLDFIRAARARGVDVTADQYPYAAWGSSLASFLPPWAPPEELPELLEDADFRRRLVRAVAEGDGDWQSSLKGVGWERIVVNRHPDPARVGRSIADLAAAEGCDGFTMAFRLLVDDPETGVIGHAMHEDDVRTILAAEDVMVGSDGVALAPGGPLGRGMPHPRSYGAFPRVFARYVRGGTLRLETAVRKMTALAADRLGLVERGRVAEGAFADLVLFDPERVADRATFAQPHAFPEGIAMVVVNGRVSLEGERRGERAGRVLRHAG